MCFPVIHCKYLLNYFLYEIPEQRLYAKKPSFWNDKLTEKFFKTILQNMSGVSQQCFLRIIFLTLSANQVLQKKKSFKTSRYGSRIIFNALSIALKFSVTLKNLSLFQWQPTNNRVTLANIDNKYNKMKETAYVQSKIRITKHLKYTSCIWYFWKSYLRRDLVYHKNYQLNPKEISSYLTPWKVIFMVSHQKCSCDQRFLD